MHAILWALKNGKSCTSCAKTGNGRETGCGNTTRPELILEVPDNRRSCRGNTKQRIRLDA